MMKHANEHHLIYMSQIATQELPPGCAIYSYGQNGEGEGPRNDNYWRRLVQDGIKETEEFDDTWVEDRHDYKIRAATRTAVRRLQTAPRRWSVNPKSGHYSAAITRQSGG